MEREEGQKVEAREREREREGERQRERERERQTDRQTETERDRDRQTDRQRDRERQKLVGALSLVIDICLCKRERERERPTQTETHTHRGQEGNWREMEEQKGDGWTGQTDIDKLNQVCAIRNLLRSSDTTQCTHTKVHKGPPQHSPPRQHTTTTTLQSTTSPCHDLLSDDGTLRGTNQQKMMALPRRLKTGKGVVITSASFSPYGDEKVGPDIAPSPCLGRCASSIPEL